MEDDLECNQVIHKDVEIPNCQESNPGDCHRRYYFFLPNILCQSLRNVRESVRARIYDEDRARDEGVNIMDSGIGDAFSPKVGGLRQLDTNSLEEIGTLPMVFAVHCLGCDAMTMSNFLPYANSRNMIVVLPEGLHNSFNAKYCCGYALQNGIDDFSFFSLIQSEMSAEFAFVNPNVSYAVGWSNGGYMVTHSASLFRAVSPISGYSYSIDSPMGKFGGDWKGNGGGRSGGKGIFIHHSLNDQFVQSTGCCHDPAMPRCCCSIAADTCIGVIEAMNNWAIEVNRCQIQNYAGEAYIHNTTTQTTQVKTEISFSDEDKGITCMTATGESCVANTTLCLHKHSGHFNLPAFGKAFPMADIVMDFFARDACKINNGVWDEVANSCECNEYATYGGVYCLDLIPDESKNRNGEKISSRTDQFDNVARVGSESKTSQSKLAMYFILFVSIIVFVALYLRKQRRLLKQNGSKKDESEFEETQELVATSRKADGM